MGRRDDIYLDPTFSKRLLRSFDANEDLGAPGGCEARKEGMVELEVDRREMVDVGVRDPVDAPNAGGDEGRLRGKAHGYVPEFAAGPVLDRQFPDDRDRILVIGEIDTLSGSADEPNAFRVFSPGGLHGICPQYYSGRELKQEAM